MSQIKKPMLSASLEGEDLNADWDELFTRGHHWLATPKADGIRGLMIDGNFVSRKFKDIPNHYIREAVKALALEGMDGEVMTFNEEGGQPKEFNDIQSDVMSRDGTPIFQFWVFDYVKPDTSLDLPYEARLDNLREALASLGNPASLVPLYPVVISTRAELEAYSSKCLEEGYEGVMLRKPGGKYKCNRSTLKEGLLIKIKPTIESEAEVIGFIEQMHNGNEAQEDNLGHTKRSSAKDGLVPNGLLGKFICRDIHDGREFNCGSARGMTNVMRKEIFENQAKYMGKVFTYSSQAYGAKDLPRIPIWKGWRDERDIIRKEDE